MRSQSAVMFAMICASAAGQPRSGAALVAMPGGFRPGRLPPMPDRFPIPAFGPVASDWPASPWLGTTACRLPVFPAALYPLFASGYCSPGDYSPASTNGVAMPPAQYLSSAGPLPMIPELTSDFGANSFAPPRITNHEGSGPRDDKATPAESGGAHFYQSSSPPPVILDEYPPLIVLKTGGVYSVTRYWVKLKTLYFVTPHGDTLYVPLALLEHVYPPERHGQTAHR